MSIMALQVEEGRNQKGAFTNKFKIGTYFTALLDRTPDLCHQKQRSLVLIYVVVDAEQGKVTRNFIGFKFLLGMV